MMKNMKKIASLALALVMALALCVPALATDVTIKLPTQTDGVSSDLSETYTAYKIFDAKVAGEEGNQAIENPDGTGSTFKSVTYTIDANSPFYDVASTFTGLTLTKIEGSATPVKYSVTVDTDTFNAAKFAEELQKVVNAEGFTGEAAATGEATLETPATLKLADGYFLIVGSLGSKAILDTVGKEDVNITTKNSLPTIDKDYNVTDENLMPDGVGGSIPYKVTINAKPGAVGYVLHDTMTKGLKFNNDVAVTADGAPVSASNYTVKTEGLTDGCTFEVIFEESYLKTITADTSIVVSYSATITADAVTVDKLTNTAQLEFGEKNHTQETPDDKVETPIYEFDLVKTNSDKEILPGAKFELYKAETGGDAMNLVQENGYYRLATEDDTEEDITTEIVAGNVTIKGLLAGTYYLEETEAPAGYNKVAERIKVEIKEGATLKATIDLNSNTWTNGGVRVENLTGAELPSTGGIGTTIFYIVGGVLVAGAAILLVTRKRVRGE